MPTEKCHDTFECRFICGGKPRFDECIAIGYACFQQLDWGWKMRKTRTVDSLPQIVCRHILIAG
jgi:hypothetical protein